jgi:hypothetical protein
VSVLVIDSDVFLIDCRYQRDAKYAVNRRFLDETAARQIERVTWNASHFAGKTRLKVVTLEEWLSSLVPASP